MTTREYAAAGVDPTKIDPFKATMKAMGKRTLEFPQRYGITVYQMAHAAGYRFDSGAPYLTLQTQEGLGNKNWIAEWMRLSAGTGRSYYEGIGQDTLLMAANDVASHGAIPFMYLDEVAAGDSEWFEDEQRRTDLAESFFRACLEDRIAMPAGESPSLRYLVKATPPVASAPSLSGCVTGFLWNKDQMVTGEKLYAGARILGAASSGLHANGISLVIKRTLALPDAFLTPLNGRTVGDEALIPTRSYVKLVEALLTHNVEVLAFLPGTGDGVAKLASDPRPFTYHIETWVPTIPPLFLLMKELGVPLIECLKTFNWGVGYYVFVHPNDVAQAKKAALSAGHELYDLGVVKEGPRQVIFGPENDLILPPGDIS